MKFVWFHGIFRNSGFAAFQIMILDRLRDFHRKLSADQKPKQRQKSERVIEGFLKN